MDAQKVVFLVIEEYPDYERDLNVFDTRAKADAHAAGIIKGYADEGVKLTQEGDLWVGEVDRISVEILEKEVE
jgi:hypothetical protein